MKYTFGLLCLGLAVILSGCATSAGALAKMEGTYALSRLGDTTFNTSPAIMRVAGNSISGQGPVNQWSAQIENGTLSGLIATRRAGDPERMRLEKELFAALEGARVKAEGDTGIRFTKGMTTVAEFMQIESNPRREQRN